MPASIGVNMRVTGHYSQGSRKHMEDKFSVAYQQTEDERDLEYAYFGIFDGHGGCEAAAYAKDHLMEAIVRQKHFWSDDDADVLRAIRNGYMITHMNMWKELEKWPKEIHGLPSTAGTTATIAFIRRGKIYVGHVGDSAIALGYQVDGCDKWKALPLTVDHKPESKAEMQRIVDSGGKVMVKAGISRVVWSRYVIGNGKLCHQEIPFLAIARSLGDHWSYNTNTDEFVVSPDPDVGVVAIDPSKFRCLIFGTDGLWNMISPKEAVESVQEAQKHNEQVAAGMQLPDSWQNPSKGLVDSAIKRWTNIKLQADNTTVVTVMMDPPGPPRSRAPAPPAPLRTPEHSNASAGNSQSEKCNSLSSTPQERHSGEMPNRPTNRTSTVPLPPVSNIPQYSSSNIPSLQTDDEDNTVNNYGNPSESYFIARLLNKTQIRNSLQHVYDEILKSNVEVPNQPQESEEEIHNNNNNIPESESTNKDSIQQTVAPLTAIETGESCQNEPLDDNKPSDSDKVVEAVAENDDEKSEESEQESIQINEVSSSSPVDSIPKLRKRKPKNPSTGDSVQVPPRNLRSHDTTPILKPQTRFSDKNQSIAPRKNVDSKVPVPVHSKSTSSRKLVIMQPKPKTFQCSTTPAKPIPTIKLEKKNNEKTNIKNQKSVTILTKDDKVDLKNKPIQPKSDVNITNVSNTRITRSKDNQVPSADGSSKVVKNASKFSLTEDNPKSAGSNLIAEKNKNNLRSNTSTRHKSTGPLTFCSPRASLKGRGSNQILENNVECFKENVSTGSHCQSSSLKTAKRRNSNGGHTLEQEPKEKRRTRLGDKRCLSGDKTIQEQHQDVSSTETFKSSGFILGLQVCNNVNCNSESSSQNCIPIVEDSTNYIEGLHQKAKSRNKKDCKFVKGVLSDDILSEVHSTTLSLENDSLVAKKGNESAIRALRPRHDAQQSLGRKVSDKRVLRSSICTSESPERRPILRLKNSTIPSKGVLRKRAAWPQAVRHGLRKRFTK